MDFESRNLINKISEGNKQAAQKLWEIWLPKINVFLIKTSNISLEDREDLLQEIMIKIFLNSDKYKSKYSVSTWIYTIAKRTLINWKKKNNSGINHWNESELQKLFNSENVFSQFPSNYLSPEELTISKEIQNNIQNFINNQTEVNHQILFLTCYENLSGRSIAKILGIPHGTIRDNLRKLKKELLEELS